MEKIKKALENAKKLHLRSKPEFTSSARPHLSTQTVSTQARPDGNDVASFQYTQTPVIKLNTKHLEKNRIVTLNKTAAATYAFDNLRTRVLQTMMQNNWKTVAVVSPTSGVGKSVVAINLALGIAQQPQRTCALIDFDLRRPKIMEYLGLNTSKTLNEYFQGEASIEDIMVNPGIPRLVILPTRSPVRHAAEVLATNKVQDLIHEMRERYASRITLIDMPPVLNVDDFMVLMPNVDCVLLVVGEGVSTEADIEEALHHIPQEKLLGIVYNRAEVEVRGYY